MALIKKPGATKGIAAQHAQALDEQGTAIPGAAPHSATPTMQPGVILQGRYMIEGTLGVGGMSVVYRGRDMRFRDVVRPCAIKEMYQSAPDSHTRMLTLKNFERESGLLATLQHPSIPKVYDFFEENGRIYLILELIPGKDYESVLEENNGPLDETHIAQLGIQLCDVLSYLHNQPGEPLIFRDMKPSNIMLTPENRAVLIDFGIARQFANTKGTMIGTEGYSPPEQYRGEAEPRSDIYALGATLHHLLTGCDPRMETPFTFQERPIRTLNPKASADMAAIVERALEYDKQARWESAVAMRDALQAFIGAGATAPSARKTTTTSDAPSSRQSTKAELIWKFRCEDELRSSPCVSSGMLFIGCYDTNLYALDTERGEFCWKYATHGGISSSAAVWQDMVVFGSEDGTLYSCDLRRGNLRWQFRTGKAIRSSPRIADRVVYVGSDDQHFYALDGLRGTQAWAYRTWMPIRSSGCVAGDSVYFGGGDGFIYSLQIKNGGVRWKQRTQQPVISTPAFSDNLVLVGSMDNNLYALDTEGGFPIWKFRTNHYVNSSPTIDSGRVYVGGIDGNLYAVELKNGKLVWKYETDSQITSSPRVENGRVYFGAVDRNIYCLDAQTGTLLWKYTTEGAVVSSPAVVDGIVYIGSMDQHVYALRA